MKFYYFGTVIFFFASYPAIDITVHRSKRISNGFTGNDIHRKSPFMWVVSRSTVPCLGRLKRHCEGAFIAEGAHPLTAPTSTASESSDPYGILVSPDFNGMHNLESRSLARSQRSIV